MTSVPALVIIDVQQGLIDGFEDDWREALRVIGDLGSRARDAGTPVVLVQHCGSLPAHPLHRSQPGWLLHPAVDQQPGEYCVDTTARRAASLGYDVDLVADGHTTSGNDVLSREQIVGHHNETLANLAVEGVTLRVLPASEVTFA